MVDALAAFALAFGVVAVLAFAVGLVAFAALLGLAEIEIEIVDELARGFGIGVLIVDEAVQLGKIAADTAFEERPPGLDHLARGRRRRRAGERLARQEPDRFGERHVVALDHVLVALAAIALLEHGGEVGGNAGHAAGAQGLDARLLDAFEDRARGLARWGAARMEGGVVVAQPERQRIGRTAHRRRLALAEIAARQRQAHARARRTRRARRHRSRSRRRARQWRGARRRWSA